MKIPLFDIDWTLLMGGSELHREVIDQTFQSVYGISNASIQEIDANGMTVIQVIIEVLTLHDVSKEDAIKKMPEAIKSMENYFAVHEKEDKSILLAGAYELLAELKTKHIPLGLLTGNTEKIAWKRIENAGLSGMFSFGAFGDMACKREHLVPIAKERAKE